MLVPCTTKLDSVVLPDTVRPANEAVPVSIVRLFASMPPVDVTRTCDPV